jgi:hypothetical protein
MDTTCQFIILLHEPSTISIASKKSMATPICIINQTIGLVGGDNVPRKLLKPSIQITIFQMLPRKVCLASTRDHFANDSTVKVVSILTILRFRFYDKLLP